MSKPKTREQVSLPAELARDARICAAELHGESLPEWLARVVRDAVARELPVAGSKIAERAGLADPKKGKRPKSDD